MNSQNADQQNSSWRPSSYMQESRNQGISRPDNYYPHYSSSQMVNDYLPNGYVYPGMMPPYRPGQFNMHPINEQWNQSYGLLNSETYSKYYNKSEPFNVQNSQFVSKNYPNNNNFYDKSQQFRPQAPYDESDLDRIPNAQGSQSSSHPPPGYPSEQYLRIQKVGKSKNVIVIESDEEQDGPQNPLEALKSAPQKVEQKPLKQLSRGNQFQPKKSQVGIEMPPKSKENQTISQVSPIVLENVPDSRQNLMAEMQQKPEIHHNNPGMYLNMPSFKIPLVQFVPLKVVTDLHKEIMQELEVAEIPDITMKLFLKFKIMQAISMYQETEEDSFKVFNLLKIYRTIILFQIERKNFIQNILSEKINLVSSLRGNLYSDKAEKKFSELCKDNLNNFKIRIEPNDAKDKHKDYRSQQMYQRNTYQPKTKKINKRQLSDHNSQQLSFNAKTSKYLQKYDLEPSNSVYSRKLRQRKKKKTRRNHNDKPMIDQKYSRDKDKPSQRQNSRAQRQGNEREHNKKNADLSHQDQGIIEKIKIWADKTVLADAIQQKHKKSLQKDKPKNSLNELNPKNDPFKVVKKQEQAKKNKQRSTKSSQSAFRQELTQKILEARSSKQTPTPNLITFATSNNLTEVEKEEYQKELNHLIKEMRNNDSHGKIRVGKEYFQAKMPNFIRSDNELRMMIKEKRERLMERKMAVLTF